MRKQDVDVIILIAVLVMFSVIIWIITMVITLIYTLAYIIFASVFAFTIFMLFFILKDRNQLYSKVKDDETKEILESIENESYKTFKSDELDLLYNAPTSNIQVFDKLNSNKSRLQLSLLKFECNGLYKLTDFEHGIIKNLIETLYKLNLLSYILMAGGIFGFIHPILISVSGFGLIIKVFAYNTCRINIIYPEDFENTSNHKKRMDAWCDLFQSEKVWEIAIRNRINDIKRNAGASHSITKHVCTVDKLSPSYIKANTSILRFKLHNQTVYILPDKFIVIKNRIIEFYDITKMDIATSVENQVETHSVPSDATKISSTWLYVNKNGMPDRRFNNNHQVPICQYGVVTVCVNNDFNMQFHVSSLDKTYNFTHIIKHANFIPLLSTDVMHHNDYLDGMDLEISDDKAYKKIRALYDEEVLKPDVHDIVLSPEDEAHLNTLSNDQIYEYLRQLSAHKFSVSIQSILIERKSEGIYSCYILDPYGKNMEQIKHVYAQKANVPVENIFMTPKRIEDGKIEVEIEFRYLPKQDEPTMIAQSVAVTIPTPSVVQSTLLPTPLSQPDKQVAEMVQHAIQKGPISKIKLIIMLESDGYDKIAIEKALEQLAINFNEQATLEASMYVKHNPNFIKLNLTTRLDTLGFTMDELEHALNQIGVDWFARALKDARFYVSHFHAATDENITKRLENKGYSENEISYALEHVNKW